MTRVFSRKSEGGEASSLLPAILIVILFLLALKVGFRAPMLALGRGTLIVHCDNNTISVPAGLVYRVDYEWLHSVEKTPIIEVYAIRDGEIVQVEAWARSFGAGHPYNSEEIGGNKTFFVNGWIVYTANETLGPVLVNQGAPGFPGNYTVILRSGYRIYCPFMYGYLRVVPGGPNPWVPRG